MDRLINNIRKEIIKRYILMSILQVSIGFVLGLIVTTFTTLSLKVFMGGFIINTLISSILKCNKERLRQEFVQ